MEKVITYKENDYVPPSVTHYRVEYKDGATYEYSPGHASLMYNGVRIKSSGVVIPNDRVPWFDGAGRILFTVIFITTILVCMACIIPTIARLISVAGG